VHVSERGAFGAATLKADTLGLPALGYVVAQPHLLHALRRRMQEMRIERVVGARVIEVSERPSEALVRYKRNGDQRDLAAASVALAEGGATLAAGSRLLEREYRQHALTATIEAQYAASDWAYERFTPHGPIALLPVARAHALVWTAPAADADRLLALDNDAFERAVSECYGSRIGAVRLRGPRASFPLKLRFAHQVPGTRVVLIGNSAQTLHPVAGQGFNLGLRDAYELAAILGSSVRNAQSPVQGLQRYRSQRRLDRAGGALFTDSLVRTFSNDNPLIACARSTALAALDAIEPAKRFLMRRMIFGAPR
jgi:2-octaprenyl-6-methoxyphenol hydroxylase